MSVVSLMPAERDYPARQQAITNALEWGMSAITGTRGLDEVLVAILDACCSGLGCCYPSIALLDASGDRLVGRIVTSSYTQRAVRQVAERTGISLNSFLACRSDRWASSRPAIVKFAAPSDATSYPVGATDNLVVRVFLNRSPLVTGHYHDLVRPYLHARAAGVVQQALGISCIALLPLLVAERCLGVLVVPSAQAHAFADLDLSALGLLAAEAAMAIENARVHEDLRHRERQVSLLIKGIIDAQEEERERICLEIHDGVAQTLAPAFHYLQAVESRAELPEDLRILVRKAGTLVRNASRESREVIATLRPAALDALGLVLTLRYEVDELRTQTGWQVDFDADQVRFPKAVETALYRIVHEAISNIAKHAHASHVTIRIKQEQGSIVADVSDDGVGFDLAALERDLHRKGVGLLSMRKRAELLQGSFHMTSSRGKGTYMRVEVPPFAFEDHQIHPHSPIQALA